MIWCWCQTQYSFIKQCIDAPWHSYIPQQINNVFRLNFFVLRVCVWNRILHSYPLEKIGEDLSYNWWFPNVSNFLSLVRFGLITTHCKINRLQRVHSCSILYLRSNAEVEMIVFCSVDCVPAPRWPVGSVDHAGWDHRQPRKSQGPLDTVQKVGHFIH